jgi:hypothetical protein
MAKYAYFFVILLSILAFTSCKFNPNLQGKGMEDIQGVWEEEFVDYQDQKLQYSKHKFRFTCDSVYVSIETFSKVNRYPDSCFNNGRWMEYAKGTYLNKDDTLIFAATFTKPNFKQKISGCYRIGQYIPAFVIRKNSSDSLYLESIQEHLLLKMTLKERTVCVQKPLN